MYEQGKKTGLDIVSQKHKHCDPTIPYLPSSPDNVKHIISAIELGPSETELSKHGLLDGLKEGWSKQLNILLKAILRLVKENSLIVFYSVLI